MKRCFKCGTEKDAESFYAHPNTTDGRLGKCKECTRADATANRQLKREYYLAYDRARANRPDRSRRGGVTTKPLVGAGRTQKPASGTGNCVANVGRRRR